MSKLKAKQILMIVSLKGGVGKSSLSTSLAVYLAEALGYNVGLWDLDITSPSVPKILACQGEELTVGIGMIEPYQWSEKLKVMSVDFLLPETDQPILFHGDDKASLIRQFLKSTDFGKVDYLVLDTPPTTSEELMTILSLFRVSKLNIIFITQPSEVSENGVIKSVRFLTDRGYPVKGIVTNMDGMVCTECDHHNTLFKEGMGVEAIAEKYDIPFLGGIPIGDGMIEETNILNGPKFVEVADNIMKTAPVVHEEKYAPKSLGEKAIIGMKGLRKLKKENKA